MTTEWIRYHGTSKASAAAILRDGARPGLNLTSSPDSARVYARYESGGTAWTEDKRKQGVVLEVRVRPEETRPGEYAATGRVPDHVVTTVPLPADRARVFEQATAAKTAAIVDIPGLVIEEDWSLAGVDEASERVVTARINGKLVGGLVWRKRDGLINYVQVDADQRRKGIATRMLQTARAIDPRIHHDVEENRSDLGKAWVRAVGAKTAAGDLVEVRYNAGNGWHSLPATGLRATAATDSRGLFRDDEPDPNGVYFYSTDDGNLRSVTVKYGWEMKGGNWYGAPEFTADVYAVDDETGQRVGSLGLECYDSTKSGLTGGDQPRTNYLGETVPPGRYFYVSGLKVSREFQRRGIATAMWAMVHRKWPTIPVRHHGNMPSEQSSDAKALTVTLKRRWPNLHFGAKTAAVGPVQHQMGVPFSNYRFNGQPHRFYIEDPDAPDYGKGNFEGATPKTVAFLDVFDAGDWVDIAFLTTRDDYRRQGLAGWLVQAAYDHFDPKRVYWGQIMHDGAQALKNRYRQSHPQRTGSRATASLALDDWVSVAEMRLEATGKGGRMWHVPRMHVDDPGWEAAHDPVENFVREVLASEGITDLSIRVYMTTYGMDGTVAQTDGLNYIQIGKEEVSTLTLLHECAHIVNRTQEGAGHDLRFVEVAARLYDRYLAAGAGQWFKEMATPPPGVTAGALKTYYHVTNYAFWPDIRANGLRPGPDGKIWLWDNLGHALHFADGWANPAVPPCILVVRTDAESSPTHWGDAWTIPDAVQVYDILRPEDFEHYRGDLDQFRQGARTATAGDVYAAERALPDPVRMRAVIDEEAEQIASSIVGQHVTVLRTDKTPGGNGEPGHLYGVWLPGGPVIAVPPGYPLSEYEVYHETAHLLAPDAGHGPEFIETYLRIAPAGLAAALRVGLSRTATVGSTTLWRGMRLLVPGRPEDFGSPGSWQQAVLGAIRAEGWGSHWSSSKDVAERFARDNGFSYVTSRPRTSVAVVVEAEVDSIRIAPPEVQLDYGGGFNGEHEQFLNPGTPIRITRMWIATGTGAGTTTPAGDTKYPLGVWQEVSVGITSTASEGAKTAGTPAVRHSETLTDDGAGWARAVATKTAKWFTIPHDDYLRTRENIPMDDVEKVVPFGVENRALYPVTGSRRTAGLPTSGLWWRVHDRSRPFSPQDATSQALTESFDDTGPSKGYSCFENPWDLWAYLACYGWISNGWVLNDDVVCFSGKPRREKGVDREPLVVPDMATVQRMSWADFERQLLATPRPATPGGHVPQKRGETWISLGNLMLNKGSAVGDVLWQEAKQWAGIASRTAGKTAASEMTYYRGLPVELRADDPRVRPLLRALAGGASSVARDRLIEIMGGGTGTDRWSGDRNRDRSGAGGWWTSDEGMAWTYATVQGDYDLDGFSFEVVFEATLDLSEAGPPSIDYGSYAEVYHLDPGTPLQIVGVTADLPTAKQAQRLLDLLESQGGWMDVHGMHDLDTWQGPWLGEPWDGLETQRYQWPLRMRTEARQFFPLPPQSDGPILRNWNGYSQESQQRILATYVDLVEGRIRPEPKQRPPLVGLWTAKINAADRIIVDDLPGGGWVLLGAVFEHNYDLAEQQIAGWLAWKQRTAGSGGTLPALQYRHLPGHTAEDEGRLEFTDRGIDSLVAYDGGTLVGYLSWYTGDGLTGGGVDALWVAPPLRRRGVASEMLARAKEIDPDVDPLNTPWFTDDGEAWVRTVAQRIDLL